MMDEDTKAAENSGQQNDDNAVPTDVSAARADYSLRASGSTYIERGKEAHEIVDRIKTSSASVIGIAGVRGAGKSSLAKKALSACSDAGFFTLLIPSPTEYDPKDFLLAIFQRIAEHATSRVQDIIEDAQSLAERGDQHARRLRIQLYSVLGAVALISLASWLVYYSLDRLEQQDIIKARLSDLNNKSDILTEERTKRTTRTVTAPVTATPTPKEKDKSSAALAQTPGTHE